MNVESIVFITAGANSYDVYGPIEIAVSVGCVTIVKQEKKKDGVDQCVRL